MYDLKQAGSRTYYIDCYAKVGIYLLEEGHVCLIDSGSDVSAARKVNQQLKEQNWSVDMIINTHSHADHISGNQYFQKRYGCKVYAKGKEAPFVQYPVFEPTFLFGGNPLPELHNKFLEAPASEVTPLEDVQLPAGLSIIDLPGHAPDMIGVVTDDGVAFVGDSVASAHTINKYHLTYLHEVPLFLETLDILDALPYDCYIPSHTEMVTDIHPLTKLNRDKVEEIRANMLRFCASEKTFEQILKEIFDYYQLRMDVVQYTLIGVTARAYLSDLHQQDKLTIDIHDNQLFWKTNQSACKKKII